MHTYGSTPRNQCTSRTVSQTAVPPNSHRRNYRHRPDVITRSEIRGANKPSKSLVGRIPIQNLVSYQPQILLCIIIINQRQWANRRMVLGASDYEEHPFRCSLSEFCHLRNPGRRRVLHCLPLRGSYVFCNYSKAPGDRGSNSCPETFQFMSGTKRNERTRILMK